MCRTRRRSVDIHGYAGPEIALASRVRGLDAGVDSEEKGEDDRPGTSWDNDFVSA